MYFMVRKNINCKKALLTNSCTASLEMAALLIGINPVTIMPSYTFNNCCLLERAIPVFVDIRDDNLNLDENLIEGSITEKTKAIVPVHCWCWCVIEKNLWFSRKIQFKSYRRCCTRNYINLWFKN